MEAFHSFWSEPNRLRNGGAVRFADYEQLTAILSSLKWQQFNGPVRMITDSEGAAFFENSGLSSFWNKIDVSLDNLKGIIDPFLFWAAGKLYALKTMPLPCVMLDTDLIIWNNIDSYLKSDVTAAHSEMLDPEVYPDRSVFRLKPGYAFPAEWNFGLDAANTAFLCIKDREFRDYYVDSAITFFRNVETEGLNPITAMCFAEQRVLPMCAAAKGRSLSFLMDLDCADEQEFATHIWGFKQVLEDVPEARYQLCMRMVKRIMEDFPQRGMQLKKCRDLEHFYDDYFREKEKA